MPTIIEWVNLLAAKIEKQKAYAAPFEARYSNEHVLPFLMREYAEVYPVTGLPLISGGPGLGAVGGNSFGYLTALQPPRTGTAGIVVDALAERLVLDGLAAPDDPEAETALATEWEDNDLDVMYYEGHRESLIASRSFVSAGRREGSVEDRAQVSVESATEAAVHRMAVPPYDVDAYLKVWVDEWTGKRAGLLRLPGRDIDLAEADTAWRDPEGSGALSRWQPSRERPTGLAGVPVVELAPRARLVKDPVSEIEPIVTQVDIIDLVEGLLVFAGHFGAVPIRWATGLDVLRDPKDPSKPLLGPNGKPLVGFNPRADHLWYNSNPDAKFGQLEPAGLASFVTWADHASAQVRAKAMIASTYFALDLKSHMSAELLKTDEAPMVRRTRRFGQAGSLNQAWRRAGQWVLAIRGHAGAGRDGRGVRVRPRWENPETRIDSQLVDQFTKLTTAGLGIQTVAEQILSWSPDDIEKAVNEAETMRQRLRAERQEDELDPIDRITRDLFPDGDPTLRG